MIANVKLKPLIAEFRRLDIGKYANTKDFYLFTEENNLDDIWKSARYEFDLYSKYYDYGSDKSEKFEEAFSSFLNRLFKKKKRQFGSILGSLLISYSQWSPIKLDLRNIFGHLEKMDPNKVNLINSKEETKRILDKKPEKIPSKPRTKTRPKTPTNLKNVFIVHGHDDNARLELTRFLKEDLEVNPIILQEEVNVSVETIISKFERLASDCGVALVLFTPDDEANGKYRARQNVILELGYFLGKFQDSRDRKIAIIKKGDIEIPSDISGVLYLEFFKNIREVFYDLRKQFEAWGVK